MGWTRGPKTRRQFVKLSSAALLGSALPFPAKGAASENDIGPARTVLERVLGAHAGKISLRLLPQDGIERFQISERRGKPLIEGSTLSALLMGVNWYLKYTAGVSVTWNGDCINMLPTALPVPSSSISGRAYVKHRFALNDTNDAYTGPYWTWEQWERQIDVLALHGINEVLVYMGAEAVYQQTFRSFGLADQELRNWFPTPAHQPWWLLQNLSSWVGPSVSQQLINARLALARKITQRLRELGMTPVLPGYYGIVPNGFAEKHPDAHVIPQGTWLGLKRPDWLDPTSDVFPNLAGDFYRNQERLLGPSSMFKMDPLHEGGKQDGVDLTLAAQSINQAMQKAHPGAVWAILGWQTNPKRELLAGIKDKNQMLILDGISDRYAANDPEKQWDNTPYAFGSIWNFGGHTAIGANVGVWNERYFDQLSKRDSKLRGIAVMPEASCNNPPALAFLSELAWRKDRPDIAEWFAAWSSYRYGGEAVNAQKAWEILRTTAYDGKSGEWSEPHDNLFGAQPGLGVKSACTWSPQEPRYNLVAFSKAIGMLLQVAPVLRSSSAYRYDLVDVARQTISNQSRILLPQINSAYSTGDIGQFRLLTRGWLDRISALNQIVGTEAEFLLGRWVAAAKAAGATPGEKQQLEFDARSLLVEWGPDSSRYSGVHDYANREWNGLLEFYHARWLAYFSALEGALESGKPVVDIDWFAMDEKWAREANVYPPSEAGDSYEIIRDCRFISFPSGEATR